MKAIKVKLSVTWKTGYKIVMLKNGVYVSYVVEPPYEYYIGKITGRKAGWGPIVLFSNLKSAKILAERLMDEHGYAILKVNYTESRVRGFWAIRKPTVVNECNGDAYKDWRFAIKVLPLEVMCHKEGHK